MATVIRRRRSETEDEYYARRNRGRKATAIYLVTDRLQRKTGKTDEEMVTWLTGLDDAGWANLAVIAGVRPPNTSRAIVIQQYRANVLVPRAG